MITITLEFACKHRQSWQVDYLAPGEQQHVTSDLLCSACQPTYRPIDFQDQRWLSKKSRRSRARTDADRATL